MKNSQLIASINLLILIILITSCGIKKGSKTQPNNPVPPTPVNGSKNNGILKANINGLSSPNQYQVNLNWENTDKAVFIRRKCQNEPMKSFGPFGTDSAKLSDSEVQSGKVFDYELLYLEGNDFLSLDKVSVEIPRDFVVNSRVAELNLKNINRLFLTPEAKINLNGAQWILNINEIISNNGTIESYDDTAQAGVAQDGRKPALIAIRAKKITGKLNIITRGEKGGNGTTGRTGKKGVTGTPGQSSQEKFSNGGPWCSNFTEELLATGKVITADGRFSSCWSCIAQATDGFPGHQGQAGEDGIRGGKGGDSGSVYIEVLDNSEMTLNLESLVGVGGIGGIGAQGGDGGDGGAAGNTKAYVGLCRKASNGPTGPQGPKGFDGPQGVYGLKSPVCLILNEKREGSCEGFVSTQIF